MRRPATTHREGEEELLGELEPRGVGEGVDVTVDNPRVEEVHVRPLVQVEASRRAQLDGVDADVDRLACLVAAVGRVCAPFGILGGMSREAIAYSSLRAGVRDICGERLHGWARDLAGSGVWEELRGATH